MPKLSLKDLNEADRPREKLAALGAEAMTSAELMAILIGSGSDEETAVDLSQRILVDCHGSLRRMGEMSIQELCEYKGIGPAKAITILASCELGRRRANESAASRPRMNSAQEIYKHTRSLLEGKQAEEFWVVLMNQNLRMIDTVCISKGGITSTIADVRLILREALIRKAPNIAVLHNHPSGNPKPSRIDDALTEKIRAAADTMDIKLIDHIVVGDNEYYSYQESGKL